MKPVQQTAAMKKRHSEIAAWLKTEARYAATFAREPRIWVEQPYNDARTDETPQHQVGGGRPPREETP
jgi:hypothetical protein